MPEAEHLDPEWPAAFRKAALRQLESLHRLSLHLTRDAVIAEDLVQETYLLALRSAHTYRGPLTDIRPWMFKIMHNAFKTRRREVDRVVFNDDLLTGLQDDADVALLGENSRLDDLDWEHVEGGLKRAIDGLPDGTRIVFLLFAVEDLKYREISEVLGIAIGTVMSRLARGRRQLIEQLASDKSIELGSMGTIAAEDRQREAHP